jgi:hypothetical protein
VIPAAIRHAPRRLAGRITQTEKCASRTCNIRTRGWIPLGDAGLRANGRWFCSIVCLEQEILRECSEGRPLQSVDARLPVGMILLARKVIEEDTLRTALAAQRSGNERLGEHLRLNGNISAHDLADALAVQWQCPAVHRCVTLPAESAATPISILRQCRMVPFAYVGAGRVLRMAFDGPVDHAAMYAVGRMLDCVVQPGVAEPTVLDELLVAAANQVREVEIDFGREPSAATIAHTAASYADQVSGHEIRYVWTPRFFWMRILRATGGVHLTFAR